MIAGASSLLNVGDTMSETGEALIGAGNTGA